MKAQTANIKSVEQKGQKIYISYNLNGSPGSYNIKLFVKKKNSNSWSSALKSVTGNVGLNQSLGSNKQIIWDVLQDRDRFQGDWVFGIEAVKEREKTKDDFSQLIINSYHGFPNTLKSTNIKLNPNYINEVNPDDNDPIDEITSRFGTVGLTIQYNPRVWGESSSDIIYYPIEEAWDNLIYLGYSLDMNYTSCNYTFSYNPANFGIGSNDVHIMEVSSSVFRFLFNLHIHLSNSLKSDPYIKIGIGGRIPTESYNSTNPDFTYQKGSIWTDGLRDANVGHSTTIPFFETYISGRYALGYNYFFSKNFGLMFEAGIFGGGLIRSGINIRFLK